MKIRKLLLLSLLMFMGCLKVTAQDFEVDGINYHLTNNTDGYHVKVIKRTDGQAYTGDIVIPETVDYTSDESPYIKVGQTCIVDEIDRDAFRKSPITSISLPNTIRNLSGNHFEQCNNLKSLIIPEGVVRSAPRIINKCEQLETFSLPATLTDWGNGYFNCKSLKSVTVSPNNSVYDSRNNCNAVIETATNTILSASVATLGIPKGVESIAEDAFSIFKFDSIYIPETVKFIGKGHYGNQFDSNIGAYKIYAKDVETWCGIETTYHLVENDYFSYSNSSLYSSLGFQNLYLDGQLITDIIFPSTVRVVRNFAKYKRLSSVIIPSTVEEIDDYAFFGCNNLRKATIEEGVKRIGDGAFYGCDRFSVFPTIPSTVEQIGSKAFKSAGYNSIGGKALSIILPKSLKQMGSEVFADCELQSIVIKAKQPPVIPNDAFTDEQYKSIPLLVPYGMRSVYEQAEGWQQFQTIIDDVEDIDHFQLKFVVDDIAYEVISLKDKTVQMISPYYIDGTGGSTGGYSGDIVIPATVTDNGVTYTVTRIYYVDFDYATSIKIPPTIKEWSAHHIAYYSVCNIDIEDLAAWCNISFYDLLGGDVRGEGWHINPLDFLGIKNNLYLYLNGQLVTNLEIPDGIKTISDAAFAGFRFKTIHIPASVKRIGARAFTGCTLESLTIPSTVESWGIASFADCENLKELTIEQGVSEVGSEAFANCSSLKKLSIPSSVKQIRNFAFYGCQHLNELSLSEGINHIGEWAFAECNNLESVDIPVSVKSIGRNAFTACKKLADVSLKEGLEKIDRYAFNRCTSLRSLHIPASVNYVGRNIVEDCTNLKSLTLDEGNSIYDSRQNCNAIIETTTNTLVSAAPEAAIPQDIEYMGDFAFAFCSDRQSAVLPEGLKRIGKDAFLHCWSLRTITIPESVDSIGPDAFNKCDGLMEIIVNRPDPCSIDNRSFFINTFLNASLIVPDNAVDKYREAFGWKNFDHIVGVTDHLLANMEPITDRNSSEAQFKIENGRIILSNLSGGERIIIYHIDGQQVKTIYAAPDGKAIVLLPMGRTYVVRTLTKAMKVRL